MDRDSFAFPLPPPDLSTNNEVNIVIEKEFTNEISSTTPQIENVLMNGHENDQISTIKSKSMEVLDINEGKEGSKSVKKGKKKKKTKSMEVLDMNEEEEDLLKSVKKDKKKKKKKADTIEPEFVTKVGPTKCSSLRRDIEEDKFDEDKDSRKKRMKKIKKAKSMNIVDGSDKDDSDEEYEKAKKHHQRHKKRRSSSVNDLHMQYVAAMPQLYGAPPVYGGSLGAYGNIVPPMAGAYYNAPALMAPLEAAAYYNQAMAAAPMYGNYGPAASVYGMGAPASMGEVKVDDAEKTRIKREKALVLLLKGLIFFINICLIMILVFNIQLYSKGGEGIKFSILVQEYKLLSIMSTETSFWLIGIGAIIASALSFVLINKEINARLTLTYLGTFLFVIIFIPWCLSSTIETQTSQDFNSTFCDRVKTCINVEHLRVHQSYEEILRRTNFKDQPCYTGRQYIGDDKDEPGPC